MKKSLIFISLIFFLLANSAQALCLADGPAGCGISLPTEYLGFSGETFVFSGMPFGWLFLGAIVLFIPAFVKMITGSFDLYLSGGNGSAEDNSKGQIKLGIIFFVAALLLGGLFIFGGQSNGSQATVPATTDDYENY